MTPELWLIKWPMNDIRFHWKLDNPDTTPWFSGREKPSRVGWYERIFSHSLCRHYWNGAQWKYRPDSIPTIHQVGDYPCWRGLLSPANRP